MGDDMLDAWRRSNGLHTVEKWCTNYLKHPAGWGALLMIHGVPEMTGRLRSKVENYAIYSALFLSMSLALLVSPPSNVTNLCPDDPLSLDFWVCHFRKRLYLYCLAIGTATHMLSILLAMAFVNALNETARDSDVYRMFARGKGYVATVKCQYAFRIGCAADYVAVVVAVSYYIGWEAIVGTVLLVVICFRSFKTTANLLFRNASIVRYWREELGGQPDKDDPYELDVPVAAFKECVKLNEEFTRRKGSALSVTQAAHVQEAHAHTTQAATAVAAIF